MHSLRREAASCRETAKQFVGKPEAPFLLRMASAFDELALIDANALQTPTSGFEAPRSIQLS